MTTNEIAAEIVALQADEWGDLLDEVFDQMDFAYTEAQLDIIGDQIEDRNIDMQEFCRIRRPKPKKDD